MSLSASWQIAFGPYVADYSRYLPRATASYKTFLALGAGSVLGTQISMIFGALAAAEAAQSGGEFRHHEVEYIVGLSGIGFAYILFMVGLSVAIALLGRGDFLNNFSAFLLFLLTFFTPWSAIVIVDYFLITKQRYDVPALSDPNGRYGKWNWVGIGVYILGVVIQLPFVDTKFFTGFIANIWHVDVSWIIGWVIPAIVYFMLARKFSYVIPEHLILPEQISQQ